MFLQRSSRVLCSRLQPSRILPAFPAAAAGSVVVKHPRRCFHETTHLRAIKPVVLADIGEGIVECEVIQWFVEPGARVEEFSPLCEVQSDKASVEITSRFAGVVTKLHYEAGEMARVGKPFVDIDVPDAENQEPTVNQQGVSSQEKPVVAEEEAPTPSTGPQPSAARRAETAAIATPAVRHLSKDLGIDISEVAGTGKDGRVLKEDLYKFAQDKGSRSATSQDALAKTPPQASTPAELLPRSDVQQETVVPLTPTQNQMFKTMTRSLTIPHFLYAEEIDFSSLVSLRTRLNKVLANKGAENGVVKLSYLPFIIKAVSMAINQFPILNARVDVDPSTQKPCLVHRSQHNIGIAMDTPSGLVVPVIKDVASRNILSIAAELSRLQEAAQAGRLTQKDMSGGTITVSNIGNIGGTYVSPVIVEREVAILGIGRMRTIPAFDDEKRIVEKRICNFSWSADHRVIDGATMARAAEVIRALVEEPDVMVMHLR